MKRINSENKQVQMRSLKTKLRVSGLPNRNGKRMWAHFVIYKDNIFLSLEDKPSEFKEITSTEFVMLQMKMQKKGLFDIKWESNHNEH